MSESAARAITIGSIVLTAASLLLAVIFARKRTRIRVGFDVARAIITVGAIAAMAAVTKVTTPITAVVLAVTVGLAVGFAQGGSLEVTSGERGLYARRNPIGLVLWGAGIVTMQAAGIAARTGTVRLGQTLAWFSASLGIGLMVGRTGPTRRTLTAAGTVFLISSMVVPMAALMVRTAPPAHAQTAQLTNDDLCDLLSLSGWYQTLGNRFDSTFPALAPHSLDLSVRDTTFDVDDLGVVAACLNTDDHVYTDGTWFYVVVYLFPSDSEAQSALEAMRTNAAAAFIWPDLIARPPTVEAAAGAERETLGDEAWIAQMDYFDVMAFTRLGPFLLGGLAEANEVPIHRQIMIERLGIAVANVQELVGGPTSVADGTETTIAPPTSVSGTAPSPGGTTQGSGDPTPGTTETGDALQPVDLGSGADEPIEPEEAAAQAITGLIAAAAIGLITWAEAAAGIGQILTESAGAAPELLTTRPSGPFIDPYDQQPLHVDPESGMVFWPWDGGEGHWVDPSEVPALLDDWNRELVTARQAQQDRIDAIIAEHESDEAAAARFGDLTRRSRERDAEMLEEIRAGRARIARNETWEERRQAALDRLEAAEADQQAAIDEWWDSVRDDAFDGILRDVDSIPDLVREAGTATRHGLGVLYDAATTWENWRIATETFVETVYDVAGVAAGGSFGDAAESVRDAASGVARVGGAIAQAAVRDPVGFVTMFTPVQDFADAVDGERTLGQRLTSLTIGLVDVGVTLATVGAGRALAVADDLVDAARMADRALDATDAVTDTIRVADRALEVTDATRDTARTVAASLDPDLADVRRTVDGALDGTDDLARRQIFQGDRRAALGRLESAGGLDNATANRIVAIHDEITETAIRRGTVDTVDEFAARHGVRPRQVTVGNSGSVGPGRSVMTDADRTIVTSFSDGDVGMWQRRHGFNNPADAAADMQQEFTRMHGRNAELALNDPTDPAVMFARQNNVSLDEAVAHLQRQGRDDPAAAARRLTARDVDMGSYSGFGSGAGPTDSYPRGYTQSRQTIQGSTHVYTTRADGSVSRYSTSGQAIIDQNELEAVRTFGTADSRYGHLARETGSGWPADPARISYGEMELLLDQQRRAAANYTDARAIAKATDRAAYVATRSGQPMANQALVQASTAMRNSPRDTARILQQLGMSESEFVDATRRMLLDYNPTL